MIEPFERNFDSLPKKGVLLIMLSEFDASLFTSIFFSFLLYGSSSFCCSDGHEMTCFDAENQRANLVKIQI